MKEAKYKDTKGQAGCGMTKGGPLFLRAHGMHKGKALAGFCHFLRDKVEN